MERVVVCVFFKSPLLLFMLLLLIGCSTQKNTSGSRWWHSFNAKYNTYYNGTLAYIDGSLEKENGNRDNFTEMIPLYTVSNKSSRELGKSNFDKAIEKCQKAIQLHSIKKRPQWTKNRKKTPRDIEWLSRREYNPFLWKAWLLMGRSQFYKGAFDEAASTFAYMSRLYQHQPAIYGKARAWLAKAYIEEGWLYDAEDVIRNMSRDSISWQARKEWNYTYADYYIHTGEFEKAIPYLRLVIKHEMRRKQKAREWYLMGQLQAAVGNKEQAYKAFKRVIRQNPPYEIEFNARIAMTEVMAKGKWNKMIGRLKRMAASDKNKDYLDQVYYAIGNIYLSRKDTTNAIIAYERGNAKATRSGIEKGVLLLHLGDLYWAREKFGDAKRCYGEAIGLLDKDRKDYEQLSQRSQVLDQLVPYTDAIHLQDSLQSLAKMPEKERNEAIDRVIKALKEKEKAERRAQQEADAQQIQNQNAAMGNNQNLPQQPTGVQQGNGEWYFYNPVAVNQGKQNFQRQWGKRQNVDNWQRVNQTVVGGMGNDTNNLTPEQQDSVDAAQQAAEDSVQQGVDSVQNDPHHREYYLAQIPFTPEQLRASNEALEDGLYNAGVIFKDKLDNLRLSEKMLKRLDDHYPDYTHRADLYYHLFLLYSRKNEPTIAARYVDKLKREYPSSDWTTLLTDPHFVENAKFGVHMEDSLYAATYMAFKAGRYAEVNANAKISAIHYPLGANRDKFLFIGGLGKLNNGDEKACMADMKEVVEKYPKSRLSEMAGMIVNGVNAGRKLHGGRFDLGDVWNRRTLTLNDKDTVDRREFTTDRVTNFNFLFAYAPDSVNENKLLFELAKFNFTNFLVRNFDINVEEDNGLHRMRISGFRNYDEALQYARQLHANKSLDALTTHVRSYVISDANLALIGQYSYMDYEAFYKRHFAPLKISNRNLLLEPTDLSAPKTNNQDDNDNSPVEQAPPSNDGFLINDNTIPAGNADNGLTIPVTPNAPGGNAPAGNADNGLTIPATTATPGGNAPADNGLTIPATQATSTGNAPDGDADNGLNIPVTPNAPGGNAPTGNADNGLNIPVTPTTQGGNTQNDGGLIIEGGETPNATKQSKVKPATTPKQDKRAVTPAKPAAKAPTQKPTTPPRHRQEDTGIDFSDGFGSTTGNRPAQEQKKEDKKSKDTNIDDEYIDLEGF